MGKRKSSGANSAGTRTTIKSISVALGGTETSDEGETVNEIIERTKSKRPSVMRYLYELREQGKLRTGCKVITAIDGRGSPVPIYWIEQNSVG